MEEEMCSITVNERNHSWVVEINDKVSSMGSIPEAEPLINKKNSIYRRPLNVGEKPDTFLYTPRIVSFGPYHHDHVSCQQTNKSKELVLVHRLKRSGKKVDDYLKALSEVAQDLQDAYDELDSRWQQDDNAFMQLMIYDGCFFLEILREAESLDAQNHLGHLSCQVLAMSGISLKELMEYYRHDMLLLENQLPMQLLVKLVAIQNDLSIQAAEEDLYKRILRFVAPSSPNIAEKLLTRDREFMCSHALDLYRHSLLYGQEHTGESTLQISEQITSNSLFKMDTPCVVYCCMVIIGIPIMVMSIPAFGLSIGILVGIGIIMVCPLLVLRRLFMIRSKPATDIYFIIPSATELDKVGIGFNINKTKSLKDISFGRRTLRLPEIYVDGATQSRLLNIIAFEQLHADSESEVTSYIYFMSRLVQVAGDVRLLQLRGIVHTLLQNDQVAKLFKSLSKDIVLDPNIFLVQNYRNVGKKVTESFHSKMNNVWQRDLWQTYLKSPWAVISVIAAFSLFTLASIQTVYTVWGYYKGK